MIEPHLEIDAVATQAPLGQHRRNVGGLPARAETMRAHDHAREPRRQRQRAQAFTFIGDAAIGIERAKLTQQATRFVQRRRGRRIQKRQGGGIADAPLRQIKHQGRQIGAENLRLGIGGKRGGLRLVP